MAPSRRRVPALILGYVMTGVAAILALAAFLVTKIGEETQGLALDAIASITE